jgi:hypothetical protein
MDMKNARIIEPSDLMQLHFGSQDVLTNKDDQEERKHKLKRAMIISNSEHVPICLYMRLPNGETLETESDVVDYADDVVLLKGGYYIPVWAIIDVDV